MKLSYRRNFTKFFTLTYDTIELRIKINSFLRFPLHGTREIKLEIILKRTFDRNAGCSFSKDSKVQLSCGNSSFRTIFPVLGITTGTISSTNFSDSIASWALRCDSNENSSWSRRLILNLSARYSATWKIIAHHVS